LIYDKRKGRRLKTVRIEGTLISCGVIQVFGLGMGPEVVLKTVGERFYKKAGPLTPVCCAAGNTCEKDGGKKSGIVIFSDRIKTTQWDSRSGERLAEYITQNKLGTVTICGPAPNPSYALPPNKGPLIAVWGWAVDHEAFEKWFEERDVKEKRVVMTPVAAVAAAARVIGR
jgi:hypothetical protein